MLESIGVCKDTLILKFFFHILKSSSVGLWEDTCRGL